MHLLLYLSALRARIGLFSLALGLAVAAAILVSMLMPESYRATASLVVDTRQEQTFSNALDALASPRERTAYMETQVDIITSPTVARRVVDNLMLTERASIREAYASIDSNGQGSIEDWLAANLLEDLTVATTQSSVIEITFHGTDPEDTAAITNAFADAYMETTLDLRTEPTRQAAAWFDEQLTTLRADLEQAQARMTDFQQTHGIVSVDERLDVKYTRFEELSAQLLRAQEQAIEHQIQAVLARRVLESDIPLHQIPEIQSNAYIQRLDEELLAGEARLDSLATQLGSNHPEYQRQAAENARKRSQIEAEARKLLVAAESGAEQNELRIAELQRALDEQGNELLGLKGNRDSLNVLMRDVQSAQDAYDTATERYIVSQVESRASQTNIAMLSRAVTPRNPYQPNLLLNVALAIVMGTALGGGLVLLAEMSDRRVRSMVDLTISTNVPLLGEIDGWAPASRNPLLPRPRGDSDQQRPLRLTG